MKILTVLGARPQFIKAAVISRAISSYNETGTRSPIEEVIVHTGQHYDARMSEIFFTQLELPPPSYHLGIGGLGHAGMTGRMLEAVDAVIDREQPDLLLVYGDTNSTLAGALAAVKRHVPVAHVEAGLRSFRLAMPEEVNRVLTDRVSRWLFCPTAGAVDNLAREGLRDGTAVCVANVGDVMYDAALLYRERATASDGVAKLIDELAGGYYVATLHREENTDGPGGGGRLASIMSALDQIAHSTAVVMPLHPRTQKLLRTCPPSAVRIVAPVGYFDMLALLSSCRGVITDSGGLQKEAYFFRKPCVTVREETEWIELVQHGANVLAGADTVRILETEQAIRDGHVIVGDEPLYGYGDAARRVVEVLTRTADGGSRSEVPAAKAWR